MKYDPKIATELENEINFRNLKDTKLEDLFLFLRDVNIDERKKKIIASYFASHIGEDQLPSTKELRLLIHYFAGYGKIGTACLLMTTIAHPSPTKTDFVELFWDTVKSRRPELNFKIERIIFQKEVLKYSEHLYEKARNNPNSFISKISVFTLLKNGFKITFPEPKPVPSAVVRRIYTIKPFRHRLFNRKEIFSQKRAYA